MYVASATGGGLDTAPRSRAIAAVPPVPASLDNDWRAARVADAHESLGQHVKQEAAHELNAVEPHRALRAAVNNEARPARPRWSPHAGHSAQCGGCSGQDNQAPPPTGLRVDHPLGGHQGIEPRIDSAPVLNPEKAPAPDRLRNPASMLPRKRRDNARTGNRLSLDRVPSAPPGTRQLHVAGEPLAPGVQHSRRRACANSASVMRSRTAARTPPAAPMRPTR